MMVNEGNDLKHDTALNEKGFQFKKNVRNSFTHWRLFKLIIFKGIFSQCS